VDAAAVLDRAREAIDKTCPACSGDKKSCAATHWGLGTQDALSLLALASYAVTAEADYVGAVDRLREEWRS